LILAVIDLLALPPIAGTEDTDDSGTVGETNRQYAGPDQAEAEVARLARTVRGIHGDHAATIKKRQLRSLEVDTVLQAVGQVLGGVPVELRLRLRRAYPKAS
jgi:hypothetical protein